MAFDINYTGTIIAAIRETDANLADITKKRIAQMRLLGQAIDYWGGRIPKQLSPQDYAALEEFISHFYLSYPWAVPGNYESVAHLPSGKGAA